MEPAVVSMQLPLILDELLGVFFVAIAIFVFKCFEVRKR
jgi:hypothetical protein